ncbi:MAG: DUF86 domain-containing protein [Rhodocyclaceae bacterium]|nr:DUF86 domain-containing protein [Rhodocyclaceae bacterium]
MTGKKAPGVYVAHALFCIENIHAYTSEGEEAFRQDRKTQDAVIRNLEVIGQCVKDEGIENLRAAAPEIDWRTIAAFRNVLAHGYLGVKTDLVWAVVSKELPILEQALRHLAANTE